MKKANQSGRSMVEMLGVLALIGMFSYGGVVAFKEATTTLRAKYIAEQVRLRVDEAASAAELSKGHRKQVYTPEYINKTDAGAYGYSFETKGISMDIHSLAYYVSENRGSTSVEVEVKGTLTPTVCKKLLTRLELAGMIQKVNGKTLSEFECSDEDVSSLTLTVGKNDKNKVSSTTSTPGGSGTPVATEITCGAKQYKNASGSCSNCPRYTSSCTSLTDFICESGYERSDNSCVPKVSDNCPAGSTYDGSATNPAQALETGHCTCNLADNSQCGGSGSSYYCSFASSDLSCTAGSNALQPSTGSGTCESITKNRGDGITGVATKNGHIYNQKYMDWWSANAWCVAKGTSGLWEAPCGGTTCSWYNVSYTLSGMSKIYWLKNLKDSCKAWYAGPELKYVDTYQRLKNNRAYAFCAAITCPDNSSTTVVAGKQLGSTDCYCNTGYIPNTAGNACVAGCLDNKDCNNGSETGDKYCKITNYSHTANTGNYWTNLSGTCTSKGTLPTAWPVSGINTYLMGRYNFMNWWSAKNLCTAHGKRLFTVEEFNCYDESDNLLKSGSGITNSWCCKKDCSWCGDDWSDNSAREAYYSSMLVNFYQMYKTGSDEEFWTSSSVENNTNNSKTAFEIYVGEVDGRMVGLERSDISQALCRDN